MENEIIKKGFEIMDEAEELVLKNRVDEGLNNLAINFQKLLETSDEQSWADFTEKEFLKHSLVNLIHQDPFTRHSFVKPRNYAGDADLIDYMYGFRKPPNETTELGNKIFEWTWKQSTAQSVRARRKIIAKMIDEMAVNSDGLRVLSIACGHLREAKISEAVLSGKIKEFFAFDQDEISLDKVKNELSRFNVKPIHSSIKKLFTNRHDFKDLDFVYAAGLYDYLPQKVAAKLTQRMFEMLKSGGRLLVANFAPHLPDRGFGETFAAWKLIYRNEAEVADFASLIAHETICSQRLFWDEPKNVIYLEVIKK
ncbi:MAG TPA: class I SAM-dependent methyltransferase [Pyrinomonadaceae bacterium]|nr:class I SAM-dependent methyltransferase [Pyrinomonadaceae bacterium]